MSRSEIVQENCVCARVSPAFRFRLYTLRQRRSHIYKITPLPAACLATGFVVCIVLFAFDPGPDLWPFGAESFSIESNGLWTTSIPLYIASTTRTTVWGFVTTAGAHIVLRYRARSALATDSPHISLASDLAELWECT